MVPLNLKNLEKTSKFDLALKCQNKIFIFKYFSKIPSEMNCTHPFYTFSYPTLYMICEIKIFLIFWLKQKILDYFCIECSEIFLIHSGICNKKFINVKNCQVWVCHTYPVFFVMFERILWFLRHFSKINLIMIGGGGFKYDISRTAKN